MLRKKKIVWINASWGKGYNREHAVDHKQNHEPAEKSQEELSVAPVLCHPRLLGTCRAKKVGPVLAVGEREKKDVSLFKWTLTCVGRITLFIAFKRLDFPAPRFPKYKTFRTVPHPPWIFLVILLCTDCNVYTSILHKGGQNLSAISRSILNMVVARDQICVPTAY